MRLEQHHKQPQLQRLQLQLQQLEQQHHLQLRFQLQLQRLQLQQFKTRLQLKQFKMRLEQHHQQPQLQPVATCWPTADGLTARPCLAVDFADGCTRRSLF